MIAISGITGLLSHFNFYHEIYFYLSDLVGYSILTNIVMCKIYISKRYCNSTKLAVYGLVFMNLTSIIGNLLNMYSPLYDTYIFVFIILLIGYIKNDLK